MKSITTPGFLILLVELFLELLFLELLLEACLLAVLAVCGTTTKGGSK